MTVKAKGGDNRLSAHLVPQRRMADPGQHLAAPILKTTIGSFAGLRDKPEPVRARAVPHFLGALLISSTVGVVSCVAALLFGLSLLESLAVYSLSGGILFAGLLALRR